MASFSMFVLPVTLLAQAVFAVPAPQGAPNTSSSASSASSTYTTSSISSAFSTYTASSTSSTSSGSSISTTFSAGQSLTSSSSSSYATIPAGCPQAATDNLVCYQCDTSFPPEDQWLSWECLAALNRQTMVKGNDGTVDGPNEADDVLNAIQVTAQAANIDPRVILAQMMQESVGFVRPGEGDNGASYGLFQVQLPPGVAATCDGTAVNTCPYSTISEMVQDGIFGHAGTSTPPQAPGIGYWVTAEGGDVARALRGYNTGSVPDPNDLCDIVATNPTTGKKYFAGTQSYVSDVANRLTGANAGLAHNYSCNLDIDPNTYVPASCPAAKI